MRRFRCLCNFPAPDGVPFGVQQLDPEFLEPVRSAAIHSVPDNHLVHLMFLPQVHLPPWVVCHRRVKDALLLVNSVDVAIVSVFGRAVVSRADLGGFSLEGEVLLACEDLHLGQMKVAPLNQVGDAQETAFFAYVPGFRVESEIRLGEPGQLNPRKGFFRHGDGDSVLALIFEGQAGLLQDTRETFLPGIEVLGGTCL